MQITRLGVGEISTNCFVAGNSERVFVVDPGGDGDIIESEIGGRIVEYILITHSHYDHIGALNYLVDKFPDAKICINPKEENHLYKPELNLSNHFGLQFVFNGKVSILLEDGMELDFGDKKIKVIHTPGHTKGGTCFLVDNTLFAGDTLFREGVGRTDLPGGNETEIGISIRKKLYKLPDSTEVLPGHSGKSTIGWEKKHNPYIPE